MFRGVTLAELGKRGANPAELTPLDRMISTGRALRRHLQARDEVLFDLALRAETLDTI
jgi:hypothetical protein